MQVPLFLQNMLEHKISRVSSLVYLSATPPIEQRRFDGMHGSLIPVAALTVDHGLSACWSRTYGSLMKYDSRQLQLYCCAGMHSLVKYVARGFDAGGKAHS